VSVIANGLRSTVDFVTAKVEAGVKSAAESVDSAVDTLKTGAAALKDSFDAGVETAKNVLEAGVTVAKEAFHSGVETAMHAVDVGVEVAKSAVDVGVKTAKYAVGVGVDVAKGTVELVSAPVEQAWLSEIRRMDSAGDSFTTTLGVGGSLKGVKLEGEGELQIRRNADNTYSLFAGGKLGAGLSAKLIETPGTAVKAEATLSMGAKVEYKFDNPEDAAKAARILSMKAVASATGALGAGYQLASAVSGDDAFLSQNLASLSFSSELAGKLKLELGLKSDIGGGVDAKLAKTSSMRLEFNKGKPALVVSNEFSGELNANINAVKAFKLEGGVKGKITTEERYELSGLGWESFSADPIGALTRTFAQNRPEGKVSLKLNVEGKFGAKMGEGVSPTSVSGSDTGSITLGISGKPSEIYNKELISSLLQLDLAKTANLLGDLPVDLKVSTIASTGIDFKKGLAVIGTGVDVKVVAQAKDDTEVFSKKTTLRETPSAISNWWNNS